MRQGRLAEHGTVRSTTHSALQSGFLNSLVSGQSELKGERPSQKGLDHGSASRALRTGPHNTQGSGLRTRVSVKVTAVLSRAGQSQAARPHPT